jgi:uncharacterized protein YeaO (DUF488 family)
MAISVVRLGSPRGSGEGVRLGTVRRPPRGVPKSQFAAGDWYDVWLPNLAPSAALMASSNILRDRSAWPRFRRAFLAELRKPDSSRLLDALAALSHASDFAVGCYCDDESRCHRSILREELRRRGASLR